MHHYPVLLPYFKCILEVSLCEHVHHCLYFCLDHLNCVKMAVNRDIPDGQVWQVVWVVDDSHVCGKKNPWWKEMVQCFYATASSLLLPKFGTKSSHIFTVTIKSHSGMRNWQFGLPWQILCEQSPIFQRRQWACSWLCFTPALLLLSWWI
jgi:hypothetical protein